MSPKNLSFEEICDDKSMELAKLKIRMIRINQEIQNLDQEKEFLEELTLKYVDKIMDIRRSKKIMPHQTSPDIEMYRSEVVKRDNKIDDLTFNIRRLERKRTKLNTRIEDFDREFKRFKVNRN